MDKVKGFWFVTGDFGKKQGLDTTEALVIQGYIEAVCKKKSFCTCSVIGFEVRFRMSKIKANQAIKKLLRLGHIKRIGSGPAKCRTYKCLHYLCPYDISADDTTEVITND